MAAEPFEAARLKYSSIPEDCFRAKVPDWLYYTSDNILAPSLGLSSEGGIKYVKVSKYDEFVRVCEALYRENTAVMTAQDIKLWVIVMPYTPLEDAYHLHQLILKPDLLPEDFAQQLRFLEVKQGKFTQSDATNLVHELKEESEHEEDEECEDDDENDKWELRRGCIKLSEDQDIAIDFLVINYSALWAKAEKYCSLQFISDSVNEILLYLANCDKLLHQPEPITLEVLQHQLDLAKRNLIFALHRNGRELHNPIHSLYPNMHAQVYGICARCDGAVDPIDDDQTMQRLGAALNDLGIGQYNGELSVEDAQIKLMSKQGQLEAQIIQVNEMLIFAESKDSFQQAIRTILQRINSTIRGATLMGMSEMNPDDALEE